MVAGPVLRESDVTSVIHLAAKKRVDESMALPALNFGANITSLANALLAM
ncbi:hypothetical protein [Pengzhenrongella sp.]|jgi:UDP-glucose 4-epimerase